jgi:beta-galactosidase
VPVAASDAPDGNKSFDDDETTAWTSQAGAAPAITYTLARPARLSEVVLKLTGWRERSYPLKVYVDDQEAWSGLTPTSLGYVTLPLKPVQGRTVRIVLAGQAEEGGGIRLTEVANQANTATGAKGVSTSTLSIVEAEFHERP